jgi:thiamine pyrophosphokinase
MVGGRWLLCAAGDWPDSVILQPLAAASTVILGVDGGTDIALANGLAVDRAAGDFDSIIDVEIERVSLPDQHASDLLKAIRFAAEEGAVHIDVVGVEGGDIAHQLGAFAALVEAPPDIDVRLHLADHIARRCEHRLELVLDAGTELSLFAFTSCPHVSLDGVEFPLDDEPLAFSTRGLHNVALGGPVRVMSDGPLVILIGR